MARKTAQAKSTRAQKTVKVAKKAGGKKTYCVMCPTWEIKHPERCSNTHMKGAKTLYFCTRRCKDKYLKAEKAV